MKKFLSMTMTLIMLMALAVPAFAVDKESDPNSEAEVQEEILESASEFAYLDADKATPELKEKILEARKEIIYNTDWVADGYVGCIRNIKTGKLIKELPEFSEVFPGPHHDLAADPQLCGQCTGTDGCAGPMELLQDLFPALCCVHCCSPCQHFSLL